MNDLLTDLVNYLKTVDPSTFDLRKWLIIEGDKIVSGCPLSYACLIPSWKAKGMTLSHVGVAFEPNFQNETGGFAVALFLNKPYQWVRDVFYPDLYKEKKGKEALDAVITRIQKEIDHGRCGSVGSGGVVEDGTQA